MVFSFNRSMALRAQANQVTQIIGLFPVIFEFTPRYLMMNVKRSAKLLFIYTAFLTGIVITFTRQIFLNNPVWASPFTVSTLPVRMPFSTLPETQTIKRTKDVSISIFSASRLKMATQHTHFFFASIAVEGQPPRTISASIRAKLCIIVLKSIAINCKRLLAMFTDDLNRFTLSLLVAFIRAIAVSSSIIEKYTLALPAGKSFASRLRVMCAETLTRTKALSGAARYIRTSALLTRFCSFIHATIIQQGGV